MVVEVVGVVAVVKGEVEVGGVGGFAVVAGVVKGEEAVEVAWEVTPEVGEAGVLRGVVVELWSVEVVAGEVSSLVEVEEVEGEVRNSVVTGVELSVVAGELSGEISESFESVVSRTVGLVVSFVCISVVFSAESSVPDESVVVSIESKELVESSWSVESVVNEVSIVTGESTASVNSVVSIDSTVENVESDESAASEESVDITELVESVVSVLSPMSVESAVTIESVTTAMPEDSVVTTVEPSSELVILGDSVVMSGKSVVKPVESNPGGSVEGVVNGLSTHEPLPSVTAIATFLSLVRPDSTICSSRFRLLDSSSKQITTSWPSTPRLVSMAPEPIFGCFKVTLRVLLSSSSGSGASPLPPSSSLNSARTFTPLMTLLLFSLATSTTRVVVFDVRSSISLPFTIPRSRNVTILTTAVMVITVASLELQLY